MEQGLFVKGESSLNTMVAKSDGNNEVISFYLIVHSLICICKYVYKGYTELICNMYV